VQTVNQTRHLLHHVVKTVFLRTLCFVFKTLGAKGSHILHSNITFANWLFGSSDINWAHDKLVCSDNEEWVRTGFPVPIKCVTGGPAARHMTWSRFECRSIWHGDDTVKKNGISCKRLMAKNDFSFTASKQMFENSFRVCSAHFQVYSPCCWKTRLTGCRISSFARFISHRGFTGTQSIMELAPSHETSFVPTPADSLHYV
jgi:hypothetical protein